jgi:hypothetical protein
MSRTFHNGDRRIRVKGIRRPTDMRRLARVLIELEAAKMETEAEAEHRKQAKGKRPKKSQHYDDSAATDTDRETGA